MSPPSAHDVDGRHDPVSIALLYPELLGTYGDGGNASVLTRRLQWRGFNAVTVEVVVGEPVPSTCDVYLMGGGEDGPQALAAQALRSGGNLLRAVEEGAVVLAVCAGFQLLGTSFSGPERVHDGLGLLDATTRRGRGARRVGEILVQPDPGLGLPVLTGYENHAGVTALGADAAPLGRVLIGRGNDVPTEGGPAEEGARQGRVIGTYLHGPVLARNPALADLLLSWVVGPLTPLDDAEVEALRGERMSAAKRPAAAFGRWRRRHR